MAYGRYGSYGGGEGPFYSGPGAFESLVGSFLEQVGSNADRQERDAAAKRQREQEDEELRFTRASRGITMRREGYTAGPTGEFSQTDLSEAQKTRIADEGRAMREREQGRQTNQTFSRGVGALLRPGATDEERAAGYQQAVAVNPESASKFAEYVNPKPPEPRNVDPLSPEGIEARYGFERRVSGLPTRPSGNPESPRSIDPLSPEGRAARLELEQGLSTVPTRPLGAGRDGGELNFRAFMPVATAPSPTQPATPAPTADPLRDQALDAIRRGADRDAVAQRYKQQTGRDLTP